ncbi:hypothetical protein GCM10010187_11890 [Actinomadura coerulea]|nr:hypothetical protein GCM10010187_11890 [Actinomadura coerulea]
MVVRELSRARIARGAVEGGDGRVAVQGAGERMLAATRSKDEYSHVASLLVPRPPPGGV